MTEQAVTGKSAIKRAIVIYDTNFGNTEKIARSLEHGLMLNGIQTICVNARDVDVESLKDYDVIAVGAPTQMFTASRSMKEFLEKLERGDLNGKAGFAFDTKLDSRLSRSAAKFIENKLLDLELNIVKPRVSAIVLEVKNGAAGEAVLRDGEEKRLEQVGAEVALALPPRRKQFQHSKQTKHRIFI